MGKMHHEMQTALGAKLDVVTGKSVELSTRIEHLHGKTQDRLAGKVDIASIDAFTEGPTEKFDALSQALPKPLAAEADRT